MSYQYTAEKFAAEGIIIKPQPFSDNITVDRNFGLPTRLYAATVGIYMTYLAIMGAAFRTDHMPVVIGICMIVVAAAFGVPALWARMKPDHDSKPIEWSRFVDFGIDTHTGRLKAKDATIQMLILPVLILGWGIAIVTIAAAVR